MPLVFGDKEAEYESLEEAQTILARFMASTTTSMRPSGADSPALLSDCRFRWTVMTNFQEDAPVSRWSRGFLGGYQWLQEDWDACVPTEFDADFATLLMVLTFFATEDIAAAYVKELGATDLATEAVRVRRVFPDAVAEFVRIAPI